MKKHRTFPRYATTEKQVGETPLVALERLRKQMEMPKDVPLAYAGRLDPMASGKLLILIGDECKRQKTYHNLDKQYTVELILGIHSDSGDVLGIVESCTQKLVSASEVVHALTDCYGDITLPYPHFSSKTVRGKPLHTWTLLGKIHEIELPKKHSYIYAITHGELRTLSRVELTEKVRTKIMSIPTVTDPKKALGADFRRTEVKHAWDTVATNGIEAYQVITFTCTASSGTYMRSLCEHVAKKLNTCGMAYSIHRTKIGRYLPITKKHGWWWKQY